jgi:predicted MFS family arabinose efflux permease
MAISAALVALASDPFCLALAEGMAGVASGCAVGLAQATLVDANPHQRERVLTRWAMLGVVGDLAAPAMIAGAGAVSIGWRGTYLLVGAAMALWAAALCRVRFPGRAAPPADDPDRDPAPPGSLFASLRLALRNRRLLAWLLGVMLCDLLDEILVLFASIHLRDALGAGQTARSLILGGFVGGGALGLVVCDRLLGKVAPLRLLSLSAGACAVLYLAWVAAPTLWLSAPLLAAVGFTAAPLYPLAQAQAYAALPGRSGAVAASQHLFSPITMAAPALLGWVADHHGTGAALLLLVVQPIGLAALAWRALRASPP